MKRTMPIGRKPMSQPAQVTWTLVIWFIKLTAMRFGASAVTNIDSSRTLWRRPST